MTAPQTSVIALPSVLWLWLVLAAVTLTKAVGLVPGELQQDPGFHPFLGVRPSAAAVDSPRRKPILLKVYYGNLHGSLKRQACMKAQLRQLKANASRLGMSLSFKRYDAVSFSNCTDAASCMEERPECFPTRKSMLLGHGSVAGGATGRARMVRGVLGNWCTHLNMLDTVAKESASYDYFLLLEDDSIFVDGALESVISLIQEHPRFWSLVAIDTWAGAGVAHLPADDAFGHGEFEHKLYSLSQTRDTYWGAHAWLVNGFHATNLARQFRATPAMPVDMFPKAPHQLHRGMWSFQVGKVKQRMQVTEGLRLMPKECAEVSGSDISGDGETDPVVSMVQVPGGARPNSTVRSLLLARMLRHTRTDVDQEPPREVVVMGMPGSGAGFVFDLVKMGLEAPPDGPLCVDGHLGHCGHIWRQTHPERLLENLGAVTSVREKKGLKPLNESVAVVVVRHPYSSSHDVQHSKSTQRFFRCSFVKNNTQFLTDGCQYQEQHNRGVQPVPRAPCMTSSESDPCWTSPAAAWSSYMVAARKLDDVFRKVVLVRYEDVVEKPREALEIIAEAAGARVPERSKLPASIFRRATILGDELYSSAYGCNEVAAMCNDISKPELFEKGYHGCQKTWPGYNEMIFHPHRYESMAQPMAFLRQSKERWSCDTGARPSER